MSRFAQASGGVSTKEGLWTWTKQVEFCEVRSSPSDMFNIGPTCHKLRANNIMDLIVEAH